MRIILKIAFSLLLFCSIGANAQEPQSPNDSALLLNKAGRSIKEGELTQALQYLDQGYSGSSGEARRIYDGYYATIYHQFADYLASACLTMQSDDTSSVISFYRKSYEHYMLAQDDKRAVGILTDMASFYSNIDAFSDAVSTFDLAAELSLKSGYLPVDLLVKKRKLQQKLMDSDAVAETTAEIYRLYNASLNTEGKLEIIMVLASDAVAAADYELAKAYYDEFDSLVITLPEYERSLYNYLAYFGKHEYLKSVGQHEDAAALALAQLTVFKDTDDDFKGAIYLDVAMDYSRIPDAALALEYVERFLELDNHASLAYKYLQTGLIYRNLGDFGQALSYYTKAEEAGLSDGSMAAHIAGALYSLGENERSLEEYERYAEYVGALYGKDSWRYAQSQQYLANITAFCGDYDKAARYYIHAHALTHAIVSDRLCYVTQSQLDSFWGQFSSLMLDMTTFGLRAGFAQDEFTKSAYNALLFSKGLLLTSERSMATAISRSGDVDLIETFSACQRLYTDIEIHSSKGSYDSRELVAKSDSLHALELHLQRRLKNMPYYMSFVNMDYDGIQSVLSDDEVVIDFTDFSGVDNPDRRYYAAFVYRKGWEYPKMLKVFEESEIMALLGEDSRAWRYYGDKAERFYELIFEPFRKYIEEGDKVYWIPSGTLHKISIESLLMQSGVECPFAIHRLSSARMIAGQESRCALNTSVLYGGLQYNMEAEEFEIPSEDRSVYIPRSRGEENGFGLLPQSLEEVYMIKDILEAAESEVSMYEGKMGTEQTFLRMSGHSPDLIHLATHGFYYTPGEAVSVNALSGYKNAMLLSGLVLSGGNQEWMSTEAMPSYLGGLLTADDIAKMDLSLTELVVLSACGTGEGEVTSEGIYGLQRAFKRAGVKHVIMTLWQVDDYVSKEFMKEFYTNLTVGDSDVHAALYQTKVSIRKKYRNPYYWAGYVLLD